MPVEFTDAKDTFAKGTVQFTDNPPKSGTVQFLDEEPQPQAGKVQFVDEILQAPTGSAKFEQIKEVPKSVLYGAVDAGLGVFEGAERGFAQISQKLSDSNRQSYDEIISQGGDAESWKAQAFDTLGTFHEKSRDFWLGKDTQGGADYIAELRDAVSAKIAPQTQGFITEVARGLGGMATLPLDMTPAGLLTITGQMFDEGYQQSTGTEAERLDKATAYAFIASPVEALGDIALKKFGGRATARGVGAIAKAAMRKIGLNFVSEGGTEVLQDAILNRINGKQMFDENSLRTFLVAGTIGTIVSGGVTINDQVKIDKAIKDFERMGLSPEDSIEATNLVIAGKIDEANDYAIERVRNLTDVIETSVIAENEAHPIDDAQAKRLEALIGKEALSVDEQAELATISMQLDESDQSTIDDSLNRIEGSDVVFDELIGRLKQEPVKPQEAQDGDTERTEKDGAEQEKIPGREPERTPATEQAPIIQEPDAAEDGQAQEEEVLAAEEAVEPAPDARANKVGISRRMRAIHNEVNEIENTPLPEREEQAELLDKAIELDADTSILIDEIATAPRVLTDIEVASLTIRTAEIVDNIEVMKRKLKGATEDLKSELELQIGIELEYLDKIESGVSAAGTKMGRALAAMNMRLIRGTYDLATSMSKARKSKGAPLTAEDRAMVSKNVDAVSAQEVKINDMLGHESADFMDATTTQEMADKLEDYRTHLEEVHRGIEEQRIKEEAEGKPKKPKKDKTEQQEIEELIRQQDVVIELQVLLNGQSKKVPTKKKDGTIFDPEGYIEMANNLRKQIRKEAEYKRYLERERQKEKTLDDDIARTTENIEKVKRTVEKDTKKKPLSVKQEALKRVKGIERDQDSVIELQVIFNEQIVKLSDKKKIVDDPEGLKEMAKNLRKMINESEWYKAAKKDPAKETKARIAALEEQIKNLEAQAEGMYRDIKAAKVIEDSSIEMLKDQIKFMKEEMRLGDELAVVNEDLRLIAAGRYSEVDEIKRRKKKSNIIKGLDKERAELRMRQDTLNQSINELSRSGAAKVFMDVADFMRAMKLSLDTWIGRQGAKALLSDPKLALSAFKDSMAGSINSTRFYEASRHIEAIPTTKHGKQRGLEIMEAGGTFKLHQEAMNSKLAERFPFVRWSNQNMILGINTMRAKMYQKWYNRYPNESDEFYEAVASFINEWTGRGTLGPLEKGAHGLSAVFTAPRWVTSNWQVIAAERKAWVKNPETGKKELDPRLLKEISTQKAKAALGFGMIASMMVAIGWELEEDPEEGDFMKLRKGDMVIDIMPGLSSNLRLLGVLAESAGARFGVGELEGRSSFSDVADRYLSYKWAPIIGSGRELITGETAIGDERRVEETLVLSITPIMLESIYQDYVKDGLDLQEVAKAQGLQWFGFGAGIYEDRDL